MSDNKLENLTPDEQQQILCDRINNFIRSEFGVDALKGNHLAIAVLTNDVTGRIDIVTGNINLLRDMKSLLIEAHDALQRSQDTNAMIPLFKSIQIVPQNPRNKSGIVLPH